MRADLPMADATYHLETRSSGSSATRRRVTPATRVSEAVDELVTVASMAREMGLLDDDGAPAPSSSGH